MKTGFLIFPGVTQLDFTGPIQMINLVPGMDVDLVWKDLNPVQTDAGFSVNPTMTIEEAPQYDVILLPGGPGQSHILQDDAYLEFVRKQAEGAKYVVGVCTGSITLAKAGVLEGRKANSHWAYTQHLGEFGAEFVDERVVVDGKFITGGGVTSGMDIALTFISELAGENAAKLIQLLVEYEPTPPFQAGRPELAGEQLTQMARAMIHANAPLFPETEGQ